MRGGAMSRYSLDRNASKPPPKIKDTDAKRVIPKKPTPKQIQRAEALRKRVMY